jgi:hypothetical protein
MVRPHDMDLRERGVAAVGSGENRRSAARRFGGSEPVAVKWLPRVAATGSAKSISAPIPMSAKGAERQMFWPRKLPIWTTPVISPGCEGSQRLNGARSGQSMTASKPGSPSISLVLVRRANAVRCAAQRAEVIEHGAAREAQHLCDIGCGAAPTKRAVGLKGCNQVAFLGA